MAKASDNDFPSILVTEQGSKPAAPAAGKRRIYMKTDHKLYHEDSNGAETEVGGDGSASRSAPQGHLVGFEVGYNGSSLTIQPGVARNDDDTYTIIKTTTITINTATTGANALDAGSLADNTWYYIYVIAKSSDGTTAGLMSTSGTSPTMPSGYDKKRIVGHIRTKTSATMLQQFTQRGGGNRRYVLYYENTLSAPFVLLSNQDIAVSPSWTTIDASGLVPPNSREMRVIAHQGSSANNESHISYREYGVTSHGTRIITTITQLNFNNNTQDLPIDTSQRGQVNQGASNTNHLYIYLQGYYEDLTPAITGSSGV